MVPVGDVWTKYPKQKVVPVGDFWTKYPTKKWCLMMDVEDGKRWGGFWTFDSNKMAARGVPWVPHGR